MKTITMLFAAILLITACSKHEDATAAEKPCTDDTPRAVAQPVGINPLTNTKQICTDVKDQAGTVVKNKDGTPKQTCKTIKIHKKHEGTAIPTK
jgi:hypothetical protein